MIQDFSFSRFSIRLGEHRISTIKDCNNANDPSTCSDFKFEDIRIDSIIVHEDYNSTAQGNDIALVRLSRDVEITKDRIHIRTICLPVDESQQIDNVDPKDKYLTIAGWGFTEFVERMSDVLIKANVSYLPQDGCSTKYEEFNKLYPKLRVNILDSQMCAGGNERVDTCNGDSGTPIVGLANLGRKSRMFAQGIVSYGVKCSIKKPFPGVYTRVSKYIKWILDNIA